MRPAPRSRPSGGTVGASCVPHHVESPPLPIRRSWRKMARTCHGFRPSGFLPKRHRAMAWAGFEEKPVPAASIAVMTETAMVVRFGTTIDPAIADAIQALAASLAADPFPGFVESSPGFATL